VREVQDELVVARRLQRRDEVRDEAFVARLAFADGVREGGLTV